MDVSRARQSLDDVLEEIQELERELEDEIRRSSTELRLEDEPLEDLALRAKKKDVEIRQVVLVRR